MQKYYILVGFALLFNLPISKASYTRDSIGVENLNGKKVVIHQVVAKDTYYSIGRRYNISPKVIMSFNDNKYLQIGVIIKVPTEQPFGAAAKNSENTTTTSASSGTSSSPTSTSDNGDFIEHIVRPKDNLNKIAEKYGTTVEELKRINNLSTINLRIAQVLKVPVSPGMQETATTSKPISTTPPLPSTPAPYTQTTIPVKTVTVPSQDGFIEHTVASNETIYSIASRYGLTMEQLKTKNGLKDNSLHLGQKLLIKGTYPVKQAYVPPVTKEPANGEPDTSSLKNPSLKYPPSRYGLNQVDEKGTAIWIMDADLDPSKMLVLHRTAPIGSIIKITNPMSNRSTFAKVVGKFTENESTKDVIIVMTKAVADALGALDKRFFCNLTYSGPASAQQDNEQ